MSEEHKNPNLNDQNADSEQELWDLLKQPVSTGESKSRSRSRKAEKPREQTKKAPEEQEKAPEEPKISPEKAAAAPEGCENTPEAEEKSPESAPVSPEREDRAPVVSERRKKALVWYLAGLFGIAFLIVLGSFMIRGSNAASAEDAAKLQAMEEQITSLTQERDTLAQENKDLSSVNDELSMQVYNMEHYLLEMAGTDEYLEGEAAMSGAEAELLSQKLEAYSLLVKAQNALIDFDRELLTETMDALAEKYTYLDDTAMNAYYTIMEQMEQPYQGQ